MTSRFYDVALIGKPGILIKNVNVPPILPSFLPLLPDMPL